MSEVSFETTTDLAAVTSTTIQANFEDVKLWLQETLTPYQTMVVTEDSIQDAKRTRADIRKIGSSIDDQRKAIKKIWMKPYEDYEAKCKELTGIVNGAVSNIDGQIKSMENEMKEQKRHRLSEFFDENSYAVADFLTFDDIFDPKWLNATFSEMDATNSIMEQIESIKEGLDTIRSMNSPYETAMLSEYGKSHNLAKALAEGRRLEAIQKAEEERKTREAEEVLAEEETVEEEAVEPPAPTPQATAQFIRPLAEEVPQEKTYAYSFTFPSMTMDQMKALKRCLIQNGIEYKANKI